ncbi:MAG: rhomboid family intramembrane serine protease [Acidimicrobiia bacterium]|nr:rhomboid family intramembrane serine protease [Acidimicrobiia bacterium]MBT8192554.1 rhomboid family intramembrane serine protease [Acidimicrobiia bacterium]NNF89428.1 rhomboid family intramembrane serine protease [Acidimicrobiia bacterium]NNJ47292.1 rhomboid family intramembrane serine protease [Acidimicrobiia bacterium]NNL13691.1 rhomboid family intramembrane serine protease [Acidimicrobiia bacterium]
MEPTGRSFPQLVALVVGGSLAAMWIVEILDSFAFNDGLQAHGIEPRQIDGLEGVVFAPVLHGGWTHLISNSVPFLVLGALVMSYGLPRWIKATGFITIVAGLATWLLARSGNHIGASILVFGYFGFLLGMAWFERSVKSIAIAVLVAVVYGGLIWGVLPTDSGVSWEGHLFGVIAGVVAAGLLNDRSRRRASAA